MTEVILTSRAEKPQEKDEDPSLMCIEDIDTKVEQANSVTNGSNYWTMDSACSFHYTHHREWFPTFKETTGDSVCLGDDHLCKVAGVGTIIRKTDDGCKSTLTNVPRIWYLCSERPVKL